MSRLFLSNVLLPSSSVVNQMFANVKFFGSAATPGQAKTGLEIPKRPVGPFLRFANEARPNMSKGGSLTDQSKILAQRWKEMSEDKKQVYMEAVRHELEAWKLKMANIKQLEEYHSIKKEKQLNKAICMVTAEHKQLLKSTEKPNRFRTAHNLYVKERMQELRSKNPDIPISGLMFSIIVTEWKTLPEEKKANYINKAHKMKADYLECVQVKTGLEIPKRPAGPFFRFANEARPNMSKEGSLTDQNKILGQRWKEMSEDKKQVYMDAVRHELEAWKLKMANIKQLEEYHSIKKKKQLNKAIRMVTAEHKQLLESTEKPNRFRTAYKLYAKERMQELRSKNPDIPISGSELFWSLVAEWKTLPEEKKANYINKANKMKADYLEAKVEWDEKIKKNKQAMDLVKVVKKLKIVKGKKKSV